MAPRPDPVLLDNGQILVPVREKKGRGAPWTMVRLDVDDERYAEWLVTVQREAGVARGVSRGLWRFAIQWTLFWLLLGLIAATIVQATAKPL